MLEVFMFPILKYLLSNQISKTMCRVCHMAHELTGYVMVVVANICHARKQEHTERAISKGKTTAAEIRNKASDMSTRSSQSLYTSQKLGFSSSSFEQHLFPHPKCL
jgi:hypothetical protein